MASLLAIDLGIRTGLALYRGDGTLQWYRSQNFGNAARFRRAVPSVLRSIPDLETVIIEGGGDLFEIWKRECLRRQVRVLQISAETWRQKLLYPRQQRHGSQAKASADDLARQVIDWSGAPRPTSLRHDAAEAILTGLWGVLHLGWLEELPASLRR